MGTTLCVMLVANSHAFIAHVGDSRIYLVRHAKANPGKLNFGTPGFLTTIQAERCCRSPRTPPGGGARWPTA